MTTEPPTPPEAEIPDPDGLRLARRLVADHVPTPSAQFRRSCWLAFQRALDPLAPPRPPRLPRH